jgi:glycerol-3-phosphate acyltransferase PlsY
VETDLHHNVGTIWLVLAGFLIGSIPFGLVVSLVFFKRDIRSAGSGNIGAANALRTLGRKAGIAVLVLDALKGASAVWLALAFSDEPALAAPLAGFAAMLGHCYSPWLRWRGGKGVATFLGAAAVLSWESALAFAGVWLAIVLTTGFSSVGSILGVAAASTVIAFYGGDAARLFAVGSLALVLWKHRENLARLRTGTENRLELLKR